MLSQWNLANAPEEVPLHPATAKALNDGIAIAIDVHNVKLTPELQAVLSKQERLQWLSISLGLNAKDLGWLGSMKSLRGLALRHAKLEGAAFEDLKMASGLQFLTLSRSTSADTDFAAFPRFERLETLCLSGKHINDKCMVHLANLRLPMLRSLTVEYASVTDEGMHSLCEACNLEYRVMRLRKKCSRSKSCAESLTRSAMFRRTTRLGSTTLGR